jgi:hypothetical protein
MAAEKSSPVEALKQMESKTVKTITSGLKDGTNGRHTPLTVIEVPIMGKLAKFPTEIRMQIYGHAMDVIIQGWSNYPAQYLLTCDDLTRLAIASRSNMKPEGAAIVFHPITAGGMPQNSMRNFRDVPLYHTCNETRQAAIKRLGVPHPLTIPFDPVIDTMHVQLEHLATVHKFHDQARKLLRGNYDLKFIFSRHLPAEDFCEMPMAFLNKVESLRISFPGRLETYDECHPPDVVLKVLTAGLKVHCSNIKNLAVDFESYALRSDPRVVLSVQPVVMQQFYIALGLDLTSLHWQSCMYAYEEVQWAMVYSNLQQWLASTFGPQRNGKYTKVPFQQLASLQITRRGDFKPGVAASGLIFPLLSPRHKASIFSYALNKEKMELQFMEENKIS